VVGREAVEVDPIFIERQLVFLQTKTLLLCELGNRFQKLLFLRESGPGMSIFCHDSEASLLHRENKRQKR